MDPKFWEPKKRVEINYVFFCDGEKNQVFGAALILSGPKKDTTISRLII